MSNLIPPLLSSSPPPIVGPLDEDDDDEFGDFRAATHSYECDDLSLPNSPKKSPDKDELDINSNNQKIEENSTSQQSSVEGENVGKDFQDRRKGEDDSIKTEIQVNCSSYHVSSEKDEDIFPLSVEENEINPNVTVVNCEEENSMGHQLEPTNDDDLCFFDDSPEFCEERTATPAENCDMNSSDQDDDVSKSPSDFSPNEIESIEEPSKSEDLTELDQNLEIKYDESPPDSKTEDLPVQIPQDDDDFGDFENHFASTSDQKDDFDAVACTLEPPDDAGEDFGDFESPIAPQSQQNVDDDEFGDFSDFSNHTADVMLTADITDICDRSDSIIKDIFPASGDQSADFIKIDDTHENVIFNALKDVTDTAALSYQWSKSGSQKLLLKALNIDLRNILYGPSWNSSMPRFAANLGATPLEPVKSEILTPTPVQTIASPSNSSQKNLNGDIPQAQFDWSGSGLINPLDSTTATLPTNDDQSRIDKSDAFSNDKTALEPQKHYDFIEEILPKMVPLRETHISNDVTIEKPNWFESTILTPELPRKQPTDDHNVDDFDDFQMVQPSKPDLSQFAIPDEKSDVEVFDFDKPVVISNGIKVNRHDDEEEFTDFSSAPVAPPPLLQPTVAPPLQPVRVEPLQPSIQYNQSLARINWPDPGVNDDDIIRNIEMTYSRNKIDPDPPIAKIDDDEWSDFVSVQQQAPPTSSRFNAMPDRTATPDLPLSVLNLNQIQPAKPPIPVITSRGLVQTKLQSPNSMPKSSNVTQTLQSNLFRPPPTHFLPSLISQQFNSQQIGGGLQATNHHLSSSGGDDDDWSDFVSSQPLPPSQNINGFNSHQEKSKFTNIITNPGHFDSFQSYVPPLQPLQPQLHNVQQRKAVGSNSIASISSMPELDFIAPKNRTSNKK